jgi:general L-amino acid transport system substrate-binding protein
MKNGTIVRALGLAGLALALGTLPAAAQSTLEVVQKRGQLLCGTNGELPGFSSKTAQGWAGLDVDMCKAVAAAVLGDAGKVTYVPLTAQQRFTELQAGKVDMLARNSTITLQRDVGTGVDFTSVNFYDGQSFAVSKKIGVTAPSGLGSSRICVVKGTTHEANMVNWFKARRYTVQPVPFDTAEAMYDAFFASRCTAMTQDATALASVILARNKQNDFVVLPQVISREPLGPFVKRGDDAWGDIVRWSFQAMLSAEELGLTRDNVAGERQSADPEVRQLLGTIPGNGKALGLEEDWAYNIIRQVGNYGESFDRNVGARSPLKLERGQNALSSKGGLMYPLPMR